MMVFSILQMEFFNMTKLIISLYRTILVLCVNCFTALCSYSMCWIVYDKYTMDYGNYLCIGVEASIVG